MSNEILFLLQLGHFDAKQFPCLTRVLRTPEYPYQGCLPSLDKIFRFGPGCHRIIRTKTPEEPKMSSYLSGQNHSLSDDGMVFIWTNLSTWLSG
jgi:hypothetical protein